ncbi:MAG: hypothetical protein MUD12_01480 [Spirochaetes bacterium]|jgi:hypothetical protein|nr:hypothetical protein [Spirochaetota bacterium]
MKKVIFIMLFFVLTVFELSSFAIGFGGYVNGGLGQTMWGTSRTSSEKHIGFGGIFDTNVGSDSLFNYRFSFSADKYVSKINRSGKRVNFPFEPPVIIVENTLNSGRLKFYRYGIENIFGFGLIRTDKIRFWVGPGLGINYSEIERTRIFSYQTMPSALYTYTWQAIPVHKRFKSITVNFELAIGLNVNLTEMLSIFLQTGARYCMMNGEKATKIHQPYSGFGHGYDCYARAGVIFRFLENKSGNEPVSE